MNCSNDIPVKRKVLGIILAISIIVVGFSPPMQNYATLPDQVRLVKGQENNLNVGLPFQVRMGSEHQVMNVDGSPIKQKEFVEVGFNDTLDLKPMELGKFTVEFRLFGYIPLRTMEVNVVPDRNLIPSGEAIGITMGDGDVVVSDYYYVNNRNGQEVSPAKKVGIRKGDSIKKIENESIDDLDSTKKHLNEILSDKDEVEILIVRDGEKHRKTVSPKYCTNLEKKGLGLYLKKSSLGVGTMTFVDPGSDKYGALGHSISDFEGNKPSSLKNAHIVDAKIVDIDKGKSGQPGQKKGVFIEDDDHLGKIDQNTDFGIFGDLVSREVTSEGKPKSIGLINHVEEGPAEILTVLEDNQVERFEIEIERKLPQNSSNGKGMVIRVTDQELLEKTGGIIQGMSGSPIIQNDRLVGAVTHVFVNDPAKGYGIFLEWMLYENR